MDPKSTPTSTDRSIDWLNISLILLALYVAFHLPYQLFLLAYAVLGPLHYLTEINWIRSKGYFVSQRGWVWFALGCSILIFLPKALKEWPLGESTGIADSALIGFLITYSNSFLLATVFVALSIFFFRKTWMVVLAGLGAFLAGISINHWSIYQLSIGLLLPTLVHVYLFTLLFMWYGALKSRSIPGYLSVLLLAACPVYIWMGDMQVSTYLMSDAFKQIYVDQNFHVTNFKLGEMLGLSSQDSFYFFAQTEWKLQVFIAFAYTYHYLNWFSKTTVIRWHKHLSRSRTLLIAGLWLLSVCLFWYDYKVGFLSLLGLSFLHVILEFPINAISIRGIGRALFLRQR